MNNSVGAHTKLLTTYNSRVGGVLEGENIVIKNPKNLIERKTIPAQMTIAYVCKEMKKKTERKKQF